MVIMQAITQQELSDVIREVVAAQLNPARVERIDVEHDVDHDGDPILRIKIVFEVEGDRLQPKAVRGLARHLREPLERLAIESFPTFSFATVDEDDAAAA